MNYQMPTTPLLQQKIRASLIHLFISILLITPIIGFMLLHFYPGVFMQIEGVGSAIKILAPVDIILGPIVTFLVYKKGKKGMTFDLIAICLCQILALGYGCWSIHQARQGFLVLFKDAFYIAPANIDQTLLKGTTLEVKTLSSPQLIFLNVPGNNAELLQLTMQSLRSGNPIQFNAQYYTALETISPEELAKYAMDIELIKKKIGGDQGKLDKLEALLSSHKNIVFYPVSGSTKTAILAIDTDNRKPITVLDIFPY